MRWSIITIGCLLVGCNMVKPQPEIITIEKPVISCPAPNQVPPVDLAIYQLTNDDVNDPGKVVQAYKATIIQLNSQIDQYRKALQFYEDVSHQPPIK